jgi:type II secretion system (T2SS) protein E
MPPRKDLGSILVDEDVLDAKDLERVARGKEGARRPLWGILVEAELVSPEQIFRAMSARFGVPVVSDERLAEVTPPEALKRAIARPEALLAGLFPIDLSSDGQRATVVMVDPSDEQTLADFLTRAQVPEGRALLARRDAITRAIERVYGETTAVVTPLPPNKRKLPPGKSGPVQAVSDEDVTGTVKLDPSLQAEIQRLPPRMSQADALTPLPQRRPRKPTPQPAEPPRPAQETASEALRAEERLSRALLQALELVARELELRVAPDEQGRTAEEMARLSRRVARKLGLDRRSADEVGAAACLFALDRKLRLTEARAADWFGELGWTSANEEGILLVLRSLTANAAGFTRTGAAPPLGARIITVVDDYLQLAASSDIEDLGTVSQLLRTSPAGAPVVDALLRVLESERASDTTPATTVTEPPVNPTINEDKTQRKTVPTTRREKE